MESPTSQIDLKADYWSNCSFVEVVELSFIHQNFYKCWRTDVKMRRHVMNKDRHFTSWKHPSTMGSVMVGRTPLVKEKEKLGLVN